MADLTALVGRTFDTAEPYRVTTERIREFAAAIGADPERHREQAPFTFPIVVGFGLLQQLMRDEAAGIRLSDVVHRDERIEQHRPVRVDDRLVGRLSVEDVRSAAGVDLISTRADITTVSGEPVCTASATLAHRASR